MERNFYKTSCQANFVSQGDIGIYWAEAGNENYPTLRRSAQAQIIYRSVAVVPAEEVPRSQAALYLSCLLSPMLQCSGTRGSPMKATNVWAD